MRLRVARRINLYFMRRASLQPFFSNGFQAIHIAIHGQCAQLRHALASRGRFKKLFQAPPAAFCRRCRDVVATISRLCGSVFAALIS